MPTTKLSAILGQKCPRCRKGPMFQYPTYHPGFRKMHKDCPHCAHRFEVEPGFFIGAMYVSYAMSVGLVIAVIVALSVLYPQAEVWLYMTLVVGLNVILYPVFLRYSRVLYSQWFSGVSYDPKFEQAPPPDHSQPA